MFKKNTFIAMNRIVKQIAKPFNLCLSSVFSSCFGRWKIISFVLMLTITLGFCQVYAQNTSSNNKATDLYSNVQISNEMKYKMPSEYLNKLNDFLKNEFISLGKGDNNTWKYTLDFALKEMESDLSIRKEYRWLFVWNAIYYKHTGDYLIDIYDYDSDIMKEFNKFFNEFEACSERYEKGYLSLLKIIGAEAQKRIENANQRIENAQKQSAEYQKLIDNANQRIENANRRIENAQKQSAEYQKLIDNANQRIENANRRIENANRKSAESQRQSAELTVKIKEGLNQTLNTYKDIYLAANQKLNDDDERLRKLKKDLPEIILLCEKYEVDYKKTLTPEMLKFYGIE